ncbi:MAG: hemin-degrading factor [Burkholderiales bacterium]|nr:MAG: hemin-degrading factor [Burkholderiales bacterium]
MNQENIRERFSIARTAGKRAKEAAESIGVSEGEAVAAHCGEHAYPPKAKLLQGPWVELLQSLEICGPLMALTRNESTVHEKTGVYKKISAQGHMGLALGEDIDLRLFLDRWHAGFAVTELAANPQNRAQTSLQFFDAHGKAIHKIFPREATDIEAWEMSIGAFCLPASQAERQKAVFTPAPAKEVIPSDASRDAPALLEAWASMKDTHDFFGLIRQHEVERQQSFRLAQGRFTRPLAKHSIKDLLMEAAFDGTPIMCFVSSPACIQIHTGPVKRIEPMDIRGVQWLNVIDPSFNLHLREDSIANVWAVEKPTADGVVTSVEAFDDQGDLMAMFFGARKPGQVEKTAWRETVAGLADARTESNSHHATA